MLAGLLALAACGGSDGETSTTAAVSRPAVLVPANVPTPDQSRFADLCVALSNSENHSAGFQVDIDWSPSCMQAVTSDGTSAACVANAATGKSVHTKVDGSFMRALFFSLSDTDPTPDGQQFCCHFRVSRAECCSLSLGHLIVSDQFGHQLSDPAITYEATLDGVSCASVHP
jgi:hypothetical protein